MLFQPPKPTTYRASDLGAHFVRTRRGDEVPVIFFNLGFELTVLYSHANAEDLGLLVPWRRYAHMFRKASFYMYLREYRQIHFVQQ